MSSVSTKNFSFLNFQTTLAYQKITDWHNSLVDRLAVRMAKTQTLEEARRISERAVQIDGAFKPQQHRGASVPKMTSLDMEKILATFSRKFTKNGMKE
ncbi:hypothetical protein T09_12397 [Trichinella sp. T9]|uniref:Uncharacterized protein n=1 Tax=Trichinella murrelli TaxID=144512 RepID=A0A0V0TKR6_9BILA|nr:hypothetical protein T05_9291 [Trichinella murrelli]KRX67249.1 hypothetical protein T09_12397 [Trichinella sp. T9]